MRPFDYYIFIDFSENYIGYSLIESKKISLVLPLIRKFKHYRDSKFKKLYIKNINKTVKKDKIKDYFYKIKIREIKSTPEIYADLAEFITKHKNIFISVDNSQYRNFKKFVNIIDGENILVKKESELKRDSIEHKLSLVIDNLLNIKRRENE